MKEIQSSLAMSRVNIRAFTLLQFYQTISSKLSYHSSSLLRGWLRSTAGLEKSSRPDLGSRHTADRSIDRDTENNSCLSQLYSLVLKLLKAYVFDHPHPRCSRSTSPCVLQELFSRPVLFKIRVLWNQDNQNVLFTDWLFLRVYVDRLLLMCLAACPYKGARKQNCSEDSKLTTNQIKTKRQ